MPAGRPLPTLNVEIPTPKHERTMKSHPYAGLGIPFGIAIGTSLGIVLAVLTASDVALGSVTGAALGGTLGTVLTAFLDRAYR